jgi:hypothetical protein
MMSIKKIKEGDWRSLARGEHGQAKFVMLNDDGEVDLPQTLHQWDQYLDGERPPTRAVTPHEIYSWGKKRCPVTLVVLGADGKSPDHPSLDLSAVKRRQFDKLRAAVRIMLSDGLLPDVVVDTLAGHLRGPELAVVSGALRRASESAYHLDAAKREMRSGEMESWPLSGVCEGSPAHVHHAAGSSKVVKWKPGCEDTGRLWLSKLNAMLRAEAVSSNAAQKWELQEEITQCRQKVKLYAVGDWS